MHRDEGLAFFFCRRRFSRDGEIEQDSRWRRLARASKGHAEMNQCALFVCREFSLRLVLAPGKRNASTRGGDDQTFQPFFPDPPRSGLIFSLLFLSCFHFPAIVILRGSFLLFFSQLAALVFEDSFCSGVRFCFVFRTTY